MIENISKIALVLSGINLFLMVLLILLTKWSILGGLETLYNSVMEGLDCIYALLKKVHSDNSNVEKIKKYVTEQEENTFGGCSASVQMEANIKREVYNDILKYIDKL